MRGRGRQGRKGGQRIQEGNKVRERDMSCCAIRVVSVGSSVDRLGHVCERSGFTCSLVHSLVIQGGGTKAKRNQGICYNHYQNDTTNK